MHLQIFSHSGAGMKRDFGILLPITALPGPHGIGSLGPKAREFVKVVAGFNARWWQILPLGPTGYGDSPYQTFSTFAGNELLISLEDLEEDGWLEEADFADYPDPGEDKVDYGWIIEPKKALLDVAAGRFLEAGGNDAFEAFLEESAFWLRDYALYTAIKAEKGGQAWIHWPKTLRTREKRALANAERRLADVIDRIEVQQFFFLQQWKRLKAEAAAQNVGIIGDIPIFVAHDSADTWSRQDLFFLKDDGTPTVIAGVPPDYFSPTGQRWGNPLYDWGKHQAESFDWWTRRVRHCLDLVDLVRIDHFRGFAAYWEVQAEEETAINGRWVDAPGKELFDHLKFALGDRVDDIIAEDLGLIDEPVERLRDDCGFPGMRVLQFSFGQEKDWLKHWPEKLVGYSGTHDNNTLFGWLESDPHNWAEIRRSLGVGEEVGPDGLFPLLLEQLFLSPAETVILPWQDMVGLGSEARINTPGEAEGNWQWRTTDFNVGKIEKNRTIEWVNTSSRRR